MSLHDTFLEVIASGSLNNSALRLSNLSLAQSSPDVQLRKQVSLESTGGDAMPFKIGQENSMKKMLERYL